MALQVKPGYQNPLTMKKERPNIGLDPSTAQKPKPEQERKALEQKRQSLQNEILLYSSTTNGGEVSAEAQKILTRKIEEVSAQLQSVKPESDTPAHEIVPRFDTYEAEIVQDPDPGIYEIRREDGKDKVKYKPFTEKDN